MKKYSCRFDTFLQKMVLQVNGIDIAHFKSQSICQDLVQQLNGDDENIDVPIKTTYSGPTTLAS